MTPASLQMDADFESIRVLGEWLRSTMTQLGIYSADDGFVGPIELAVHELATNCIDHAAANKISVDASVSKKVLTINVTDDGVETFDLSEALPAPEEPQVRGYGLMIVEQVASSVDYRRTETANEWKLEFSLHRT